MKRVYLFLALLVGGFGLQAQTASVQIIHNSPSAAADTVKVWLDDAVAVDSFAFRTATAFLDIPVASDISVTVFSATDTTGAVLNIPGGSLMEGETYIAMASGEVGTDFNVRLFAMAQTSADTSTNTSVVAFHGSPDAPAVDVTARGVATLFDALTYPTFGAEGYVTVPSADYKLDITVDADDSPVATFKAPLSAFPGESLVVYASGYLDTTGGLPGFGLFATSPAGGPSVALPQVTTASVQVIHNSPSAAADTVAIWLDDAVAVDTFPFRTATPFLDLPVAADISVTVFGAADTSGAVLTIPGGSLTPGETYIAMASGEVGNDFNVRLFTPGQPTADSASTAVLAFHGSPDAPAVDVTARDVATLFDALTYPMFGAEGYVTVPSADYILDVTVDADDSPVASFEAPLSLFPGEGLVVFASGYLDTTGGLPGFGLYATSAAGGDAIALAPFVPMANVQIIHNSPNADTTGGPAVDIVLNGMDTIADVAFRQATGFLPLPGDTPIDVQVLAAGTDVEVFSTTLGPLGEDNYVVMAAGVAGSDGADSFRLAVLPMARMMSVDSPSVDLAVFHGSPDAPAVDVDARFTGGAVDSLVDGLAFGSFQDYASVPPLDYRLDVRADGSADVVATFAADVRGLFGGAAVVFASGFLANADADPFGLWVTLPDGTTFPLAPVLNDSADVQIIHNSPAPVVDITITPLAGGDAISLDSVAYRTATPFVRIPSGGYEVSVDLPGGGANVLTDTLAFIEQGSYGVIANGIAGDTVTPFELAVSDFPTTSTTPPNGFDITLFHGSQDAPTVDLDFGAVNIPGVPPLFTIPGLAYGTFQFVPIPPSGLLLPEVFVTVRASGSDVPVKIYKVVLNDVIDLGFTSAIAIASGLLGADDETAFALLGVLPDGTVVEFEEIPVTSTTELPQSIEEFVLFPNPVRDRAQVRFNLLEPSQVMMQVFDLNGRMLMSENLGNLPNGTFTEDLNTSNLPRGTYLYRLNTENGSLTARFTVVR